MLEAIDRAEHSIFLSTFIFRTDKTGRQFIEKLIKARKRSVEVKIILDGIGEYYSLPRAGRLLKKGGVDVARFLPACVSPRPYTLTSEITGKSLLLIKGRIRGGMNIGSNHLQ